METSDRRGPDFEEIAPRRKRKSHKRKEVPTLETEKEIFLRETLEQIEKFREARRKWLEENEDESDKLFEEDQTRRKRQSWLKRMGFGKSTTRSAPPAEVSAPVKFAEEGRGTKGGDKEEAKRRIQEVEVKPTKSIMKIVTKEDIEERERRTKEREDAEEAGKAEGAAEVRFVDEREPAKRRKREPNKSLETEHKRRRILATEKEREKEKRKPLKFEKIPGPEDQCKCDHSGEYTVLVKGVCFCDRPRQPTCIPIIPPEYFDPRRTGKIEPDVKIERKDSLMYHKGRRSKDSLFGDEEVEDKMKNEEKQEKLIQTKPETPPTSPQEIAPPPKTQYPAQVETSETVPENPKTASPDEIPIEKLLPHHKHQHWEDPHRPIHFQELTEDQAEDSRLKRTNSSTGSISDAGAMPSFMPRRKGSRIPARHGADLFEKPVKSDNKKGKPEHGHVHFDPDTVSPQDSNHEVSEGTGESFKRKQDKTTMTVLVNMVYNWWKGNPK